MVSKHLERLHLEKMIRDLRWTDHAIEDGTEPPDFFLRTPDGNARVAVEVTRIYLREGSKGSPEAAQERHFEEFVSQVADEYWGSGPTQPIQVSVVFPPPISSDLVRPLPPDERRADQASVRARVLARLRLLPRLAPWESRDFHVRQRDGRPLTFHVLGLPAGTAMERRWEVVNNTVGWHAIIDTGLLQRKVSLKARDLPGYRASVHSALLLVVADGSTASGFLEMAPDALVDPEGFDGVYFQRFPFDSTEAVRLRTP